MALNFPFNPTLNQYWVDPSNLVTYKWNGFVWTSIGGAVGDQGPQGFQGAASTVPGPQGVQGVQGGNWTRTGTTIAPKITGDVVNISAGTAALPGLTPVGDPDTGIYSPGANQLAVSTGGTGRLFVSASGRVGVGTASPTFTLDVAGSCRVGASDTSTAGLEVGIGATGDRTSYIDLVGDTTYSDFGLRVIRYGGAAADSEIRHRGTGNLILSSFDSGVVSFNTASVERMRITSAGLVGIGTGTPSSLLHIQSTGPVFTGTNTTAQNTITGEEEIFKISPTGQRNGLFGAAGSIIFRQDKSTWSSANVYQKPTRIELCTQDITASDTSETPRLVITAAGRVGIGTVSPNARLSVAENSAGTGIELLSPNLNGAGWIGTTNETTTANGIEINATRGAGKIVLKTGNVERLRISSAGNVGIGTSAPGLPLEVHGDNGLIALVPSATNGNTIRFGGVGGTANQLIFTGASDVERMRIKSSGIINFSNAPVYADNTAASAGGLVAGDIYRKADGTLMIAF
jgi:hypothetical protein